MRSFGSTDKRHGGGPAAGKIGVAEAADVHEGGKVEKAGKAWQPIVAAPHVMGPQRLGPTSDCRTWGFYLPRLGYLSASQDSDLSRTLMPLHWAQTHLECSHDGV